MPVAIARSKHQRLFSVSGLVAVITGGGSGIGWMMAKTLAEGGAHRIYIVGRRRERLEQVASEFDNVVPLCADVTKKDELKKIAEIVRKDVGYINMLVANAGMTGPGLADLKSKHTLAEFVEHAWKASTEEFNAVYDLNCSAVFYSIIAFMELLDAGNNTTYPCKSQVVATASTASFLRQPRAGFAYTSSKAALVSMIKSFSSFCVPWGIRFNSLAAGLFASELSEPLFAPFRISKTKALTEEGVFSKSYQPAERAGSEEDMAGAILYLASPAGSFCNGSVMLLDGGKLGTMPATY